MNQETTAKLAEIGHRMCTQDNRITAEPLFVVQQKRRIWGIDTDYDPEIAYMWRDDSEYTYDSREAAEEYLREGGYDLDRFDDLYREVGYIEIWEFVTAHLTERAAQRYIDENNHNLHNPRIYVTSQYRCDEFNFVANALRGLGRKLHEESER